MSGNPTGSALLVIDMENAFISKDSPLCTPMAGEIVPACVAAVNRARGKGIPVFFVKRIYRSNGSDVEHTRYGRWAEGGRPLGPSSTGPCSAQAPEGLRPMRGDYTIIKPRFSAFFQTELDLLLRRQRVRTVLLCGTATPNCIRTTAYDAISLDYNVVLLEDCCASATREIQDANMADMERVGARRMMAAEFENYGNAPIKDAAREIWETIEAEDAVPEPFSVFREGVRFTDNW